MVTQQYNTVKMTNKDDAYNTFLFYSKNKLLPRNKLREMTYKGNFNVMFLKLDGIGKHIFSWNPYFTLKIDIVRIYVMAVGTAFVFA